MYLLVHAVVGLAVTTVGGLGGWQIGTVFAEADAGGIAALAAIFSAIGYAANWLVQQMKQRRKDQSDEDEKKHVREQKAKDDEITHWKNLVARYENEHKRLVRVERKAARSEAWIHAQQMIMRHQKIDFIPYDPTDDDDDDDSVVTLHGPNPNPPLPPAGGVK